VELHFPIEFVVNGTPVSLQGSPRGKEAWKDLVRNSSRPVLPEAHQMTEQRLAVTLLYFPVGEMEGDIDNIVKPVLDALNKHIYFDDHQVNRVWVEKFEEGTIVELSFPSEILESAIQGNRPALYIRLSDDLRGDPNK
jgi:crossover junction endodeoxyribonuclease RusA